MTGCEIESTLSGPAAAALARQLLAALTALGAVLKQHQADEVVHDGKRYLFCTVCPDATYPCPTRITITRALTHGLGRDN